MGRQLPALGSAALHMHGHVAADGTWPPAEVGHKLQGLTRSTWVSRCVQFLQHVPYTDVPVVLWSVRLWPVNYSLVFWRMAWVDFSPLCFLQLHSKHYTCVQDGSSSVSCVFCATDKSQTAYLDVNSCIIAVFYSPVYYLEVYLRLQLGQFHRSCVYSFQIKKKNP